MKSSSIEENPPSSCTLRFRTECRLHTKFCMAEFKVRTNVTFLVGSTIFNM